MLLKQFIQWINRYTKVAYRFDVDDIQEDSMFIGHFLAKVKKCALLRCLCSFYFYCGTVCLETLTSWFLSSSYNKIGRLRSCQYITMTFFFNKNSILIETKIAALNSVNTYDWHPISFLCKLTFITHETRKNKNDFDMKSDYNKFWYCSISLYHQILLLSYAYKKDFFCVCLYHLT